MSFKRSFEFSNHILLIFIVYMFNSNIKYKLHCFGTV